MHFVSFLIKNTLFVVKVPFLKLAGALAARLGHDPRQYNKQLSELRYSGVKTETSPTLLEVVR